MGIERVHDDFETPARKRQLAKGTLEQRVEALERIVIHAIDHRKLTDAMREDIKRIGDADTEHPDK